MNLKRVSQQFIQLNLSDNLAAARTNLDQNPGFMAVILDNQKKPVSLITDDDLVNIKASDDQLLANIAGQIPPGLVIDVAQSMDEFTKGLEFTAFSIGAKGAIVFDKDQLIGILTEETITSYLRDEFKLVDEVKGFPSASRLAGSIVNNPIIMFCGEFNHRNELDYYNRHNPPQCQEKTPHPHPIRKKN